MSRRALLLGAAGLGLGACGFRPMYGPPGQGEPADISLRGELAAVRVARIPERNGQLVQRALERRFEGVRPGEVSGRYELVVGLGVTAEILGYRRDGAVTRVRYVASADWVLSTMAVPAAQLARGNGRALDAYNIPDQQFFAADSARLDMEGRLMAELVDQIFEGVARELRQRLRAGAAAG